LGLDFKECLKSFENNDDGTTALLRLKVIFAHNYRRRRAYGLLRVEDAQSVSIIFCHAFCFCFQAAHRERQEFQKGKDAKILNPAVKFTAAICIH